MPTRTCRLLESEVGILLEAVEFVQPFFYGGVAVVAFVEWRRHPGPAGAWLCAAFATLATVLIAGRVLPETSDAPAILWARKALLAVLVLFPYCLYRFMRSFVRPIGWIKTTAAILTAAVVLGALVLPSFPETDDPRPAWLQAYIAALLIQWVFLSGVVALRLWRAGRGQPIVARRRMRMMSLGAAGLALALVVAGEFSNGEVAAVVVQLLALAAAPMMLIGFAPPFALRAWWRRDEEAALKDAELSLMEATSTSAVAATLLPHARRVLGGESAVLYSNNGEIVGRDGELDERERVRPTSGTDGEGSDVSSEEPTVNIALRSHRLIVHATPFTPFFGREEIRRLESFAALADLALARNALLEDQQRLATIVRTSSDAIYAKALDGTIMSWNEGAEGIYGYTAEEIVGRPVSILVPPNIENDVPAILARVRSGESIDHYESKRQTKAGEIIDVSLSVSPLRNGAGEIEGASVIARDVTAQRAAEVALAERETMLRTIFETSPDIIAMITSRLELTYVNPAALEILGYSFDQLFGEDSPHWVHPDDIQPAVDLLQAAFGDGGTGQHRLRVKNAAEEWIWLDIRIRRMGPEADTAVVLARNVTDQVRLEQGVEEARKAAVEANQAKSEFLSRMSHELRTPLNAILGFAQLLEMDELGPGQRESTEQIVKGGRRLLELINEVLDIARIESGRLALSLEPVLVCDLIDESIALIKPLANERGVRVQSECTDKGQHVKADRHRLGQVLLNLLSNGVKYNVAEGAVTVTCTPADEGRLRIGVTDTGPGIAPEKVPLLFTPFERLGAEQSAVEGTGLGLALSKNLVEAMGGTLSVDTMNGHGTTFWIDLAVTDETALTMADEEPPVHEGEAPSSARVLYIEDNLANLTLIQRLLSRRSDVEVISAMSGILGLDLARQHLPDLILLDLGLPDIKGDEVLIRLRKDPKTAHIPIVILSADATPGEINRLLAAGAADYLTKPIDVAVFLRIFDRHVRGNDLDGTSGADTSSGRALQ